MALQFDDILLALCSDVKPSHANDFQKIYALQTAFEAKLAFDVLVAYGFDAKVYHTPEKPSKLYISHPNLPPEQLEVNLSAALAYAQVLKQIKTSLDQLCESNVASLQSPAYTMAFVNSQPSGKQIMIQITPAAANDAYAAAAQADLPVPAKSAAPAKISSSQAKVAKKMRRPKDTDDFAAGPAVGRGLYPTKILPEGGNKRESLRRRIMLRLFGNFATSSYAALMWLVLFGVAFSFFVFAKSFLCYDFVAKKNNKWYCQDPGQVSEEDLRKQQQQERQKQLGLQPINQP